MTEMAMLSTNKKAIKTEESKLSIEDESESSDQLSDMSSERVKKAGKR